MTCILGLTNITCRWIKMCDKVQDGYADWITNAAKLAYPLLGKLLGWSVSQISCIIDQSYSITEEESERIAQIPQRTPEWYRIRNGWVIESKKVFRGTLVSSSVVGKILHHEGSYGPPDKFADGAEKMYPMLFKTQRGTAAEEATQQEFAIVLNQHLGPNVELSVEEVGIRVNPALPYCAASIDSKLHMLNTDTLEYSTGGLEMKCRGTPDAVPPQWIPKNYYDQLLISMYIYGWQQYWFVFHSKTVFSVELFEFDAMLWQKCLAIVDVWYWSNYWPTLVLAHCKMLVFDTTDPDGFQLTFVDEKQDAEMVFAWAKSHHLIDYLSTNVKRKPINSNC